MSVDLYDGPCLCDVCGMIYSTQESDADHAEYHQRFVDATTALGYIPARYAEREAMKAAGRDLLYGNHLIEKRVEGALQVARAWFDRSLDRAIGDDLGKVHPSYAVYLALLIASPGEDPFPSDVMAVLWERLGRSTDDLGLLDACRYWCPATSET